MRTLTATAAAFIAALRTWAKEESPIIAYRLSKTVAERKAAARAMQREALALADRLEQMSENELESYVILSGTLDHDIYQWDPQDFFGLQHRRKACFDAAIARRDERLGFRRDEKGRRQRRNAAGQWEHY